CGSAGVAGVRGGCSVSGPAYLIGLDLGQSQDPTALVVVERTGEKPDRAYAVRSIERVPLASRYPAVVAHTAAVARALLAMVPSPSVDLVVDRTGVGRAVGDLLTETGTGCPVTLVTITGADAVARDADGGWRVPKRDLAGVVQVLLQAGRLRIADTLPIAN